MAIRGWFASLMVAVSFGVAAADAIEAVYPHGSGVLTKCRDWLVASSCRTYHHISLPSRIAVGDTIFVSFGSDRKEYGFFVARIALEGDKEPVLLPIAAEREGVRVLCRSDCARGRPLHDFCRGNRGSARDGQDQHHPVPSGRASALRRIRVSDDAFGAQRVDLRSTDPEPGPEHLGVVLTQ